MSKQTTTLAQQLVGNTIAAAAMIALILLGAAFLVFLMRLL
jgi:hypothetical protein